MLVGVKCKYLKETDEVEFQQYFILPSNGSKGLRRAFGSGGQ